MKQNFFKISGITGLILLLQIVAFSQDGSDSSKPKTDKIADNEEIIIKSKTGKDSKITLEIRDGQVTINGKPIDEFEDDDVSIKKRRNEFEGLDNLRMIAPHIEQDLKSPFRGGTWNIDGEPEAMIEFDSKSAFLGVTTESADKGGTEITEVVKGSAAEKTGLKKGDVITRIGDRKVDSQDDIVSALRHYKPQDKVTVTFRREGKEEKLTATLGQSDSHSFRSFNYSMPKIKDDSRIWRYGESYTMGTRPRLGIKAQDTEDGKGVKVLDVDDDSPADKAGIKEGDIITQFDGKEVNSAQTLGTLARENRTKYEFKVKLTRDGKEQDLEVKIPRKLKTEEL
jgi:serine protease Do